MKRMTIALSFTAALLMATTTPNSAKAVDDGTIGTIIGAVGGGVIGSTIGKGNGRIVATAAGTMIGAVLGHEVGSSTTRYEDDDYYERPRRRVVERERIIYREARPREKIIIVKERPHKKRKWQQAGVYKGDVIVCNKKGKRCQWVD
ncbi:glycine zipper 2TM domain-containing protein [Terasakiella pusilla]|uniref:glycine zipper 2TM domain-containing protein n=1 Tax=Terasakiella pusilla TaxID=64973 RepID=UPI003AA9303C